MANASEKWPENAPGKFFVDQQCIRCGYCWREAPQHFASHGVDAYAYVQTQPENSFEIKKCQDILDTCPVQAIGQL